ncbi:S49 family peptidase [Mesorhizobium sp. B2-8-9]|uniref:S49 family peptidase n=1 Tax=Mesorhizobium sp. B2-8-9 TaxID=2589899 RepID=UPI001127B092|nr:S49 family peptidase [Mesorhizobium sp. B2-8-9]TPI86689.1 S49 family peptidase [Mesorhizobium sp. B2-8-9]
MPSALLASLHLQQVLVRGESAALIEASLAKTETFMSRVETASDQPRMMEGSDFWFSSDDWRSRYRPYNVVDGVLQIPVKGVLLHDFPWQYGAWATGYEYIWQAFKRGQADGNVRGIALVEDTPGGMVAGCFDLVDRIYATENRKPLRSFAMESAYSAGYALASVADSITVSRTGGVGSIGVVTMHVDVSKALDKMGLKITFIHFGKHKVDGNAYEPLPADVEKRIQARIDELGEVFVASVARNRGMDAQAIRDTEALCFTATEAVSNGLADAIGSLDDAVAAFAADLSLTEEDEQMAGQNGESAVDQAAINAARTEGFNAGKAEGKTEGVKEGATAERVRITAIIGSDEGKKRPKAALSFALKSDMNVEQSQAVLADLAEEKAEAPQAGGRSQFEQAMDGGKNADLGTAGEQPVVSRAKRANAAAGFKVN